MPKIVFRSLVPLEAAELFRWHVAPGAFSRLAPPFQSVRLLGSDEGLRPGDVRHLRLGLGPFSLSWEALHDQWVENSQFRDVQRRGPFARWEHTHRFRPAPPAAPGQSPTCWLEDEIDFRLPGPRFLEPLAKLFMHSQLLRTFLFRHWRTRFDALRRRRSVGETERIVLTGGHGLVGSQLQHFLRMQGFQVIRLVRGLAHGAWELSWDPYQDECSLPVLEGARAVIHLSGHSLMDGSWDEGHRRKMWDSRVLTTRRLVQAISRLERPPELLISASGVGFYGEARSPVTEQDQAGRGFLADLCRAWEGEAQKAEELGVRTVQLRLGAVLTAGGGALREMLLPFWLGLGSTISGGRAPFSWISLEDVLGVILHAIEHADLTGPVNAVAPEQIDFRGFADQLAKVMGRPRWLDVPAGLLRPVLGAKLELLTQGTAALPQKLDKSGFSFLLPQVERALGHELGYCGSWIPPGFGLEWGPARP